jgi:hypothetical protein
MDKPTTMANLASSISILGPLGPARAAKIMGRSDLRGTSDP